MLVRLIYASRSTADITEDVLGAILVRSARYNPDHGITGILCADPKGKAFLQALEGGRAAVNALYANIVRDPRHTDVTLLEYAEVTERCFANWRMGGVNLSRVNMGSILRFSESPILDPFTMNGRTALLLLQDLANTAAIASREGA